jgi:hypothetical protein
MDELVRMSLEQRSIFSALSRFLSKQATDDAELQQLIVNLQDVGIDELAWTHLWTQTLAGSTRHREDLLFSSLGMFAL